MVAKPAPGPLAVADSWQPRPVKRATIKRLLRARLAVPAMVLLVLLVCLALLADLISPYDPVRQVLAQALQGPSPAHLLGTDELGRDVLARMLYGARISLQVGLVSVGVALVIGTLLGLIAGYFPGGWRDSLIMRSMDAMLSFPQIVLALAITALLGPNLRNTMIAIAVVDIPVFVRLVRGQVLSVRKIDFVESARAVGASNGRLIGKHVLPNILSPIIVLASLRVAQAILAEATLSFLGLGVQPPTPTWGTMLASGRQVLGLAPWLSMAPGTAIFLTVLSLNLLGDAIRDVLDPRLKS
jgi:peptide/nickel transport system permease protein